MEWALLAPLAFLFERDVQIDLDPRLAAMVVYNGVVATAFGMWAVVTVNRALPASTTSVLLLGVPVAGLIFSFLLLGEPIGPSKLVGLALIIAGIGLVSTTMAPTTGRQDERHEFVPPLD